MAKVCQITGKRPAAGNNRSHSMRATRRRFIPNVTKKTIIDPETGEKVKIKLSTRAQRTLMKNPKKYRGKVQKLVAKAKKRQS